MQTLTEALESALKRRSLNVTFLSGSRPTSHTLDTIAECEGRATACRSLLAISAAERRDHAIRLMCELAQAQPVFGNARLIRDAEIGLYADAVSGRISLI